MIAYPPGYFDLEQRKGHLKTGHATVGTSVIRVLAENLKRVSALVCNDGADTVYIGDVKDVTNGDGFALLSGITIMLFSNTGIHAKGSSSLSTISWMEEEIY